MLAVITPRTDQIEAHDAVISALAAGIRWPLTGRVGEAAASLLDEEVDDAD